MTFNAKTDSKLIIPQTEVHCSSQIHRTQDPRKSYLLRFPLAQTLPQKVHCRDVCLLIQALPCPSKNLNNHLKKNGNIILKPLLIQGDETAIEGSFHDR